MTDDDLARQAAACGLALSPTQMQELARAHALARGLADLVPHDLPLTEEPALTFRVLPRERP